MENLAGISKQPMFSLTFLSKYMNWGHSGEILKVVFVILLLFKNCHPWSSQSEKLKTASLEKTEV